MNGFLKFFVKMEGEPGAGGGGTPAGGGKSEVETLKEQNAALEQRLAKLEKSGAPAPKETDLHDTATQKKKDAEEQASQGKRLESAIKFNLVIQDFVKNNKDLLPDDFEGILKAAGEAEYDSEIDKATATRASMLKAYFSIQANVDAVATADQRAAVIKFMSLTKKSKEEAAPELWTNVFEPTVEIQKRIKKAEELGKGASGTVSGSSADKEYLDNLVKTSREAWGLGSKG